MVVTISGMAEEKSFILKQLKKLRKLLMLYGDKNREDLFTPPGIFSRNYFIRLFVLAILSLNTAIASQKLIELENAQVRYCTGADVRFF
jgi:hypothetical protein